jgi:hypothetical protein
MSKQDIRKQLIKNKQTTTTKEKESEYTYVDKVEMIKNVMMNMT